MFLFGFEEEFSCTAFYRYTPFDFKSVCTFSNWERIHPKTLTWLRSDKHTSPIITIRSKPITQIKYVLKCNFLCSKLPFLWALFHYKKDFLHSHLLTLTPFLKHYHFIAFIANFIFSMIAYSLEKSFWYLNFNVQDMKSVMRTTVFLYD